jgi:hypothetical protein
MMAKKGTSLIKKIKGPASEDMIGAFQALCRIKSHKKDYGEETKSLQEEYLRDCVRYQGINGKSTSRANDYLGTLYFEIIKSDDEIMSDALRLQHCRSSQSYCKEASRLYKEHYGPNDNRILRMVLLVLAKILEGENQ